MVWPGVFSRTLDFLTGFDFYDQLKSITKGYASMDYEFKDYMVSKLVKLDILLNSEPVDALSLICHDSTSYNKGKDLASKLRKIISRLAWIVNNCTKYGCIT